MLKQITFAIMLTTAIVGSKAVLAAPTIAEQLATLRARIVVLEKEMKELRNDINTGKEKVATLHKELNALKTKEQSLNSQIAAKNDEIKGWTHDLSLREDEYKRAKNNISQLESMQMAQDGVSSKKCKQGSHESHAWIKAHYKNCINCRVESIKAGACSKNKKAHKHYYCDCDC